MKTIAVCNEKGGVAKSTTTISVATRLAQLGKHVLVVDADSQGNTTSVLVGHKDSTPNLYHLLKQSEQELQARNCIHATQEEATGTLLIIPSSKDMKGKEVEFASLIDSQRLLQNRLEEIQSNFTFDYCLIDCPPGTHLINLNCLFAASMCLVPIFPNLFSIEGIADLITDIEAVSRSRRSPIEIHFLMTIVEGQTRNAREIIKLLRDNYGERVYNTIIPKNVRVSEANTNQMSIFAYDNSSKGAQAYIALVEEMLDNE